MVAVQEKGLFTFRVYDSDGKLQQEKTATNALTSQGGGRLFKLAFISATTGTDTGSADTAYIGMIDNVSFGALASSDVAAQIIQAGGSIGTNNWFELDDDSYTARLEGTFGVTDNAGTTTSSKATWTDATFTFTSSQVIHGAFLANFAPPGSTSGALFATAVFSAGNVNVDSSSTLKITFEMSLS